MNAKIPARWYFDIISPYAYLHLRQFHQLRPALDVEFVPVLFAGLLKSWGTKGPVEVPAKRLHTYRQCVWIAGRQGVPFRMPARHPFNPLAALRLLAGTGASRTAVEAAFDFVWGQGRDPEVEFDALAQALGVPDAAAITADPAVKEQLIANTNQAIAEGVFGVPTFVVRGELFWGSDTVDWLNAYVDNPALFDSEEMRRASEVEFGVHRRA
jgi:2-hydroxychromene-2-carboxylate isomerase